MTRFLIERLTPTHVRAHVVIVTWFALLILAPAWSAPAEAETLYKIYGPRGSVTFTSRRPPAGARYDVLSKKTPNFSIFYRGSRFRYKAMQSRFDEIIRTEAAQKSLDPALVKAVVHAESLFDPSATSHKGAMGLMQLMPATARRMGVEDAYHPEQNISGGTKYLRWLIDRYEGNLRLAVAAYNAGEGAVDEYKGVPPYSETVEYVKRVMTLAALYRNNPTGGTKAASSPGATDTSDRERRRLRKVRRIVTGLGAEIPVGDPKSGVKRIAREQPTKAASAES